MIYTDLVLFSTTNALIKPPMAPSIAKNIIYNVRVNIIAVGSADPGEKITK